VVLCEKIWQCSCSQERLLRPFLNSNGILSFTFFITNYRLPPSQPYSLPRLRLDTFRCSINPKLMHLQIPISTIRLLFLLLSLKNTISFRQYKESKTRHCAGACHKDTNNIPRLCRCENLCRRSVNENIGIVSPLEGTRTAPTIVIHIRKLKKREGNKEESIHDCQGVAYKPRVDC
jgi:hypothetical protein